MINRKSTFLFVRHAESEKNLRDITGGVGERLTNVGMQQAVALAKRLRTELGDTRNYAIVSSDAIQAEQTANEIAKAFSLSYDVSVAISHAGLGIAEGLTGEQISQLYPDIFLRLNSWRKQEIEAIDLNIPGMEPPVQFWIRILSFLNANESDFVNIVVCTRSVMVLIANLVKGNNPQKGGGYKHLSIKQCDIIAFEYQYNGDGTTLDDYSITLLDSLTTVDLGNNGNE